MSASRARSGSRALPVLGSPVPRAARSRPVPGCADRPVVAFVSLGCPKNLVDSEVMLGALAEAGCLISADESAADTVVVNTCGFLSAGRDEALEVCRELAQRKRAGRLRRIVVAGCLVQRDGTALREHVPEIDALVGVNNRDDIVRAVLGGSAAHPPGASAPAHPTRRSASLAAHPPASADLFLGDYYPQPWSDRTRLRLTPAHYAFVRISEGCDQKCTFCTIPSIRGPMRSKTPDELARECRTLIADGARELILIGQDTTSYGVDLPPGAGGCDGSGLAGLLRRLDRECDGARWIRLMYVYPSVLTDAMLDAIAECRRVVKYIDIPLQHISDRVLKAMHRRVTRAQTERLLERIRRRVPGVTIRTTFIVGFPGETEAEFAELLEFVRGFGFDAAGAFRYSPEPGTPAGRMRDQVPPAVQAERYQRLMLAQQEVAFARAAQRVGRAFSVLVDRADDDGRCIARHAGQAPDVDSVCRLERGRAAPGRFLRVRCVAADGYDLIVRPVRAPRTAPA